MHSGLYDGWVRHRRLQPSHVFRYRLFMMYLDLAEIDEVFRTRWLWGTHRGALVRFRRTEYLGDPDTSLDEAVRERVGRETGRRPTGPIRVLTNLAHFGYTFNPVTFYYCFDRTGARVETIVVAITNTPWGERHEYVLQGDIDSCARVVRRRSAKEFHVSPFMPMGLLYNWRFTTPGRSLAAHIDLVEHDHKIFDATLVLRRREITAAALAYTLLRYPLITLHVTTGIYWQALRLYLKRARFHAHPRSSVSPAARATPSTGQQ